ncbi:MAG: hypothetical protein RLZZ127_3293 [Planctomycetota bacterium]
MLFIGTPLHVVWGLTVRSYSLERSGLLAPRSTLFMAANLSGMLGNRRSSRLSMAWNASDPHPLEVTVIDRCMGRDLGHYRYAFTPDLEAWSEIFFFGQSKLDPTGPNLRRLDREPFTQP